MSFWTLKRRRIPLFGKHKKILLLRGLFGTAALVLIFSTLQQIPLATAVVLHYLAPIFTALLGMLILKEKLYTRQYLFFGLSFLGILLVKGFDLRISTLYFAMGIVASFLAACAYISIRMLKSSEHPLVIVFYFPLIALPFSAIFSFFQWVMPQGIDWLWLLATGLLTQIAQILMTKAYQKETAAKVSAVSYIGILYALFFGFFLFDETFNIQVILGIALVLSGVLLNIGFKRKVSA